MDRETLALIIQELKILKGNLIVASSVSASEAGIIQLSIAFMESIAKEERIEEKVPLNEDFVELCSFLLMEANSNHGEVLRSALNQRYVSLKSGASLPNAELELLEDIRSLLSTSAEITTPSSADLLNQIRGGRKDG